MLWYCLQPLQGPPTESEGLGRAKRMNWWSCRSPRCPQRSLSGSHTRLAGPAASILGHAVSSMGCTSKMPCPALVMKALIVFAITLTVGSVDSLLVCCPQLIVFLEGLPCFREEFGIPGFLTVTLDGHVAACSDVPADVPVVTVEEYLLTVLYFVQPKVEIDCF